MCGLKLVSSSLLSCASASHPSWVCGLKPRHHFGACRGSTSHPSWVCGLKHHRFGTVFKISRVTPFVGVWIETVYIKMNNEEQDVTPFVGVWIEILPGFTYKLDATSSHPSWVCGLKHHQHQQRPSNNRVTPFVGVWIETIMKIRPPVPSLCHTLRGCVD